MAEKSGGDGLSELWHAARNHLKLFKRDNTAPLHLGIEDGDVRRGTVEHKACGDDSPSPFSSTQGIFEVWQPFLYSEASFWAAALPAVSPRAAGTAMKAVSRKSAQGTTLTNNPVSSICQMRRRRHSGCRNSHAGASPDAPLAGDSKMKTYTPRMTAAVANQCTLPNMAIRMATNRSTTP